MPALKQTVSLDLSHAVGGHFEQHFGYTTNYTDPIAISSVAVFAVDLTTLSPDIRESISKSKGSLQASFDTSTSNLVKHTLYFSHAYDNNDLDTFFSNSSSTTQSYNASRSFSSSPDGYEITTYDIRKGSLFADSINQNVTQTVDILSSIKSAIKAGEKTSYFYWTSSAGIDTVKNFQITGTFGEKVYSLPFSDSAAGSSLKTLGQSLNPFGTIGVGGAGSGDIDVIPIDYQPGDGGVGGATQNPVSATPFKVQTVVTDATVTIRIHQDRGDAGSLTGATSKMANGDGSVDYTLTGTTGTISDLLHAMTFTPTKGLATLNTSIPVTFTFREIDNGQNADLGISKSVTVATNSQVVAPFTSVRDVVVNAGQTLTVGAFGTSNHTVVNDGGNETIEALGTSNGAELSGTYDPNGFLSFPTGMQHVLAQGTANGTILHRGGGQSVQGIARSTLVEAGGWQAVGDGGYADLTTVAGGAQTIFSGGISTRSTVAGGTIEVGSGGIVDDVTIKGGKLLLAEGAKAGSSITFNQGTVDRLEIYDKLKSGETTFSAKLVGLESGDRIDLGGLSFANGKTTAYLTKDTLTVTQGKTSLVFKIGSVTAGQILLSDDGHGGTLLTAAGDATQIGADRLTQTFSDMASGTSLSFRGGTGVDTLELSAGVGVKTPIEAKVLPDGSVTFTMDGRTIVVGPEVERFVIRGSDGNDSLVGSSGADWLDGGKGADRFEGSAGNDGYVFDHLDDRVSGERSDGGVDTIWSSVSVDLGRQDYVENLRLQGTTAINGTGNDLANLITGNAGGNVIAGGKGNDTLWGKGGADTFVFSHMGAAHKDMVWNFDSDDHIRLEARSLSGLHAKDGVLDAADFVIGAKADANHAQVIYNKMTGVLAYDADGTGAGAAQDIAFIGKNLAFMDNGHILLA